MKHQHTLHGKSYATYGLHEVYSNPEGWTVHSMIGHFETKAELIKALETMLADVKRFPNVFKPSAKKRRKL